jgi:hypothetical protein
LQPAGGGRTPGTARPLGEPGCRGVRVRETIFPNAKFCLNLRRLFFVYALRHGNAIGGRCPRGREPMIRKAKLSQPLRSLCRFCPPAMKGTAP